MWRRASTFSATNEDGQHPETLQVGDRQMNTSTWDVSRSGRLIHLSVKEHELLNFLMLGQGKVLERAEIMRGVWGENFYGDDNLLDVYIRHLRRRSNRSNIPH